MSRLLRIDSSPMGTGSISRALTEAFACTWLSAHPHGRILLRDLAAEGIPPIDAAWIAANFTPKAKRTTAQHRALTLSTALVAELLEADEYVIGVPMHNWGPPACRKLWADQIVRFEETVLFTPTGPTGALRGKRAAFIIAAGAAYAPGARGDFPNHVEPWLRTLFGYLGVGVMRFVLADRTTQVANGTVDRESFLARHMKTIRAIVEEDRVA